MNLTSNSYSQNFNSLSTIGTTNTWQNNSTLIGWYVHRELPTGAVAATTYRSDHGAQQGLYAFGAQSGLTTGDRAFGSIAGSTVSIGGNFFFGVGFTNSLLATITDISINYSQETWRIGSAGLSDIVNFQYSVNASGVYDTVATWQNLDSLDMTPALSPPAASVDGNNNSVGRSGLLSNLAIADGTTIWIRWVDIDTAGGNDYGMGIDDLTINFTTASGGGGGITTTPEPFTMVLTGLGAATVLRRKLRAKQKLAPS